LAELKLQAQALERELEQVRLHLATASTRRSAPVAAVDDALCTGCGICASVCPNEAIVIKQTAVIDPERCCGCGACVQECPRQAIRLV
jgi:ferredoxin